VFVATKADDNSKRQKVADSWSKMLQKELTAADINCDGCTQEGGRLFGHCQTCSVRLCGQEEQVENCAHCGSYSCEKLDGLLKFIPNPAPRKNLENIRKDMGK
ncbi:MAG: DUF3795 domain-containing protein, partial [bacterium]|nr:DUF3795 domain-containing protein [bacterium]